MISLLTIGSNHLKNIFDFEISTNMRDISNDVESNETLN